MPQNKTRKYIPYNSPRIGLRRPSAAPKKKTTATKTKKRVVAKRKTAKRATRTRVKTCK